VVTALQDGQLAALEDVDEPVLLVDPARPAAAEGMLQRLRLPDAAERPRGLEGCFVIAPDTATWIWRASDPKRLTTRARRAIDEAERVLVSAISVWEVAMLVAKRRIRLDRPAEQWVGLALALPGIQRAPLERAIAVRRHQIARRVSP
jgi:PIN domain nuclease of toxin-antitoxin system